MPQMAFQSRDDSRLPTSAGMRLDDHGVRNASDAMNVSLPSPMKFSSFTHSEQFLEILNQPGVIHQAPARFSGDQQIQVAVLIGITVGNGAKHTQVAGAAPSGQPEDLLPPFRAQRVQGDHVSIVQPMECGPLHPLPIAQPLVVVRQLAPHIRGELLVAGGVGDVEVAAFFHGGGGVRHLVNGDEPGDGGAQDVAAET